ncbi:hypothetical protein HYH03_003350 [Edaphochlamys debaryana]|uniref:U-box domain-containing protein n=1 Tax=Edaphochlamys debaryana TaxID=47281 RepID=A0A835YBD2_9CHLO|nr:hypothetical protein HYH03_003350 [Edaphochlamys debaryana]|eukprot:KAG2498599.1 hypothetical protein HYH03_003350 [Edaphochlamys debaryana]
MDFLSLVVQVVQLAKALADQIKSLKELKGDAIHLSRQIRAVEDVVELAREDLEKCAADGRRTAAENALKNVLACLQECQKLVKKLSSQGRLVQFVRAGDHVADVRASTSKLAASLAPLQAVLGLQQQAELRDEFEAVRAGLTNVRLEVLRGMEEQGAEMREHLERLEAASTLSSAQREAEMRRPSQQDLQSMLQALQREAHSLRAEKEEAEAHYLEQVMAALSLGEPGAVAGGAGGGSSGGGGTGRPPLPGGVPASFVCPIRLQVMRDPAMVVETGCTYERSAIERHLASKGTDPLTNVKLTSKLVAPNRGLRDTIEEWLQRKGLSPEQADTMPVLTAAGPGLPPASAAAAAAGSSGVAGPSGQEAQRQRQRQREEAGHELLLACGTGEWDRALELLAADPLPHLEATNEDGATPLIMSAIHGNVEVVRALLAAGARTEPAGKDGATPLIAAAYSGHAQVARALLAAGARIEAARQDGATPLIIAAFLGHTEVVEVLLAAGARADDVADEYGSTPLIAAAVEGRTETVGALLAAGARTEAANLDGDTPLIAAAAAGHTETVRALLAAGARIEAATQGGTTSLGLAAQKGHTETVTVLLAAGARVEAADEKGFTALVCAAVYGHVDTVRALLAAGASKTARGSRRTAREWAEKIGHTEAAQLLRG